MSELLCDYVVRDHRQTEYYLFIESKLISTLCLFTSSGRREPGDKAIGVSVAVYVPPPYMHESHMCCILGLAHVYPNHEPTDSHPCCPPGYFFSVSPCYTSLARSIHSLISTFPVGHYIYTHVQYSSDVR